MTYETKYELGEVVYTSSEYGTDKVFIDAIKFSGKTRLTVRYGIKRTSQGGFFGLGLLGGGDGMSWYSSKDLFTDPKLAELNHQRLKEEKEKREELTRTKEQQAKIIEAEARLAKLKAGIDPDEDWED